MQVTKKFKILVSVKLFSRNPTEKMLNVSKRLSWISKDSTFKEFSSFARINLGTQLMLYGDSEYYY